MIFVFQTSLDGANTAFELEVSHAFSAHTSVVFLAAVLHLLARTSVSDEVTTFARVASKVVVAFALLDDAAIVGELKGRVALSASMI